MDTTDLLLFNHDDEALFKFGSSPPGSSTHSVIVSPLSAIECEESLGNQCLGKRTAGDAGLSDYSSDTGESKQMEEENAASIPGDKRDVQTTENGADKLQSVSTPPGFNQGLHRGSEKGETSQCDRIGRSSPQRTLVSDRPSMIPKLIKSQKSSSRALLRLDDHQEALQASQIHPEAESHPPAGNPKSLPLLLEDEDANRNSAFCPSPLADDTVTWSPDLYSMYQGMCAQNIYSLNLLRHNGGDYTNRDNIEVRKMAMKMKMRCSGPFVTSRTTRILWDIWVKTMTVTMSMT